MEKIYACINNAEISGYIANLSVILFYFIRFYKFIVYTASSEKIIMNELGLHVCVTTTP
jgi:hypothetical protein